MALHFFFMWLFVANGVAYVLYLAFSGEWRKVLPDRHSLRDAVLVTLHDLHLRSEAPPQGLYNGAQRIAYTGVIVMAIGKRDHWPGDLQTGAVVVAYRIARRLSHGALGTLLADGRVCEFLCWFTSRR